MSSSDKGAESQGLDISLAEENASLLDAIIQLCKRSDGKNVEVIMLIGKSGAGKSAMINTIHKALTGNYYQIAKLGRGHAQSVTLDLGRYEHCGVSLNNIADRDRKHQLGIILTMLPHIMDCAGLGDVNTPALAEILELLIGGFIPPSTHIQALESKQNKYGVGCLKRIFPAANPSWVVSKVVFMQSCRDTIPKNLIECLAGILKLTDPATLKRKYTAEMFLLITKYDHVRGSSVHITNVTDTDTMTLEEFEKMENDIAPEFNIEGALDLNRIRWVSFTDRIGYDNPNIDNIALKFVKRMIEPGAPVTVPSEPVVGLMKSIELYMFMLYNQAHEYFLQDMQLNITPALVLVGLVFVIAIAVLYKLLSASV